MVSHFRYFQLYGRTFVLLSQNNSFEWSFSLLKEGSRDRVTKFSKKPKYHGRKILASRGQNSPQDKTSLRKLRNYLPELPLSVFYDFWRYPHSHPQQWSSHSVLQFESGMTIEIDKKCDIYICPSCLWKLDFSLFLKLADTWTILTDVYIKLQEL